MKLLMLLFRSFFKIGLIAFGGGYAVAPLLQKEVVENREWIASEELTDIMAIAQTLPGVIFTNSATMIGYKVAGLSGSAVATISAIIPTFMITILVTVFFWNFTNNPIVQKAFVGILIGVTSLVIYSITKMWKSAIRNYFDIILVVLSSLCLIFFKINAVFVILGVAIIGFAYNLIVFKIGRSNNGIF